MAENSSPGGLPRLALWIALFISAAVNAVCSSDLGRPVVGAAFGLVTVACAGALAVDHYRRRRRFSTADESHILPSGHRSSNMTTHLVRCLLPWRRLVIRGSEPH